ncbi:MAG TPA: hypothetical protein VJZ26_12310 [Blastocatellia bacterium]|nr:hypothetical protein [Blastocatellia bacterium]
MKRIALTLSLFIFLPLASATNAVADGPKILNTQAFGSTPNITIRTVPSGGAPWVVDNGKVQLDPDGRLRVRVKGLLITEGALANGNPVPANLVGTVATVTAVHAALTCGGPGNGVPFTITSTDAVPLSPDGDFEIDARISVPSVCAQPIVLIRIGTPQAPGPWIAASALPGMD